MNLVEHVRRAGVVGAGGGGFPTHVKLGAKADTVIANGAECEPLLHKDAAVMEHQADQVVAGVRLSLEAVGAREGVVAIKAKNRRAVEAIQAACRGTSVRVQLLGDYYPAGDEYDLVHEVTGRLIPPAGIPIQIGAVVNNVETFANIAAAAEGRPVLAKTLTIAGAVRHPVTLTVPVGTSFRECIEAAGGLTVSDPVLCVGGLMMGVTTSDLEAPVVKTTTGVVILPREHPVIQRKLRPPLAQAKIGKSACDQCRYCTEFCPRFLLGYAVEPHQVMRSLAFTATGKDRWNSWAWLCCACGLCTLYACPEGLFPKEACDDSKAELRRANYTWSGPTTVKAHPLREARRVPIKTLMKKLSLEAYDAPAHWEDLKVSPRRVTLPLKPGAGAANQPLVKAGDRVKAGQVLGQLPPQALGALIHAPFDARVTAVADHIILEKGRMKQRSIGLIELSSVAAGFLVADTMLKAGKVELLLSRSICSGKYMVLIGGETAAVQSAVAAGAQAAQGCLIDQLTLANVHAEVFTALGRSQPIEAEGALGILESFNVATLIQAADVAAKAASVTLIELRLAMALGGKAFVTLTGDVGSVEAAMAAGRQVISDAGVLVNSVIISRPHPDLYHEVI